MFRALGVIIVIGLHFLMVVSSFNTYQRDVCSVELLRRVLAGQCRWLYGEVPVTGLSNQITTVYSLLPLSRILNSSLLISGLHSRASFELTMKQYGRSDASGKVSLNFADMFDEKLFITLHNQHYAKHDLVIAALLVDNCLQVNTTVQTQLMHTIQRKGWKSSMASQIILMLDQSRYSSSHVHQLCPHILRFKSVGKLLGLFNFRDKSTSTVDSSQLLTVHRHIRPSRPIRDRVETLRNIISVPYFALHVRLEPDVFPRSSRPKATKTGSSSLSTASHSLDYQVDSLLQPYTALQDIDGLFFQSLRIWLQSLLSSVCIHNLTKAGTTFPPLYVASGLISSAYLPTGINFVPQGSFNASQSAINRGEIVLRLLREVGFRQIFSKVDLDPSQFPSMPVELDAYVDLEVARHSQCFIPAHIRSSFSYLGQRLRELDRNITLSAIGKPNGAYQSFFI